MKATNKIKTTNNLLDDKDISHVTWWKEVSYLHPVVKREVLIFIQI